MYADENTSLLCRNLNRSHNDGLSTLFAIICILDVFGVFPIVTLPRTIIDCGKSH